MIAPMRAQWSNDADFASRHNLPILTTSGSVMRRSSAMEGDICRDARGDRSRCKLGACPAYLHLRLRHGVRQALGTLRLPSALSAAVDGDSKTSTVPPKSQSAPSYCDARGCIKCHDPEASATRKWPPPNTAEIARAGSTR